MGLDRIGSRGLGWLVCGLRNEDDDGGWLMMRRG